MKIFVILSCIALAAAYEDLDNYYMPTLIVDPKALLQFLGCLVEKNPCNEFGEHAKSHVLEALSDGCRECDDAQKHYLLLLIGLVRTQYPDYYRVFQ